MADASFMRKVAGPYEYTATGLLGDKRSTMLESELQLKVYHPSPHESLPRCVDGKAIPRCQRVELTRIAVGGHEDAAPFSG